MSDERHSLFAISGKVRVLLRCENDMAWLDVDIVTDNGKAVNLQEAIEAARLDGEEVDLTISERAPRWVREAGV